MNKSTTIETWHTNPADIGPLYPYVGTEMLFCALCAIFFVGFIIWKFKTENQIYNRQTQVLRKDTVDESSSSIPQQTKRP